MPEFDWNQVVLYAIELGLAAIAGGLVGMQRAWRGKSAGMRTHILICVGSALFMQVSRELVPAGTPYADPGRIAAQVVTGIGFIGAGPIIRSGFTVAGLTSAATIWAVSGLGLAAGAQLWEVLVVGTLASLATLELLTWRIFFSNHRTRGYSMKFRDEQAMRSALAELRSQGARVTMIGFNREQDGILVVEVILRWSETKMRGLEEGLTENVGLLRMSKARGQ